jgi:hypothetical protein
MHSAAVAGAEYFGGVKWRARPVDKVGAISHLGSTRPVCDFPSAGPDPPIPSFRTNLTNSSWLVKAWGLDADADSISSCLLDKIVDDDICY